MFGALAAAGTQQKSRDNRLWISEWADPDLPVQYPVSSGWVDVDSGIDSTGATDVTSELVAYFAGLSANAKVRFPVDGVYRIDGSVVVEDLDGLSIDGRNSTFQTADDGVTDRTHFEFIKCDDLYITNTNVDGPTTCHPLDEGCYNGELETQHGFAFRGCSRVLLEDSSVSNVWGDWIYVGRPPGELVDPTHITVRDCTFVDVSRQGVAWVAGSHFLVENCTMGYGRRAMFDIEPNGSSSPISHIKIKNNTIQGSRLNWVANGGGASDCSNVWIEGNLTEDDQQNVEILPPADNQRYNWVIINNTSTKPEANGAQASFRPRNVDGFVCYGNTQPVAVLRRNYAVMLKNTRNWAVWGNDDGPLSEGTFPGQWRQVGEPFVAGTDPTGLEGATVPAIVTSATAKTTALDGDLDLTIPAVAAVDDFMFVAIGGQTEWDEIDTADTPAGWTNLATVTVEGSVEGGRTWIKVFYKKLVLADLGGTLSWTITPSTKFRLAGLAMVQRGAATVDDASLVTGIEDDNQAATAVIEGPTSTAAGMAFFLAFQGRGDAAMEPLDPELEPDEWFEFRSLAQGGGSLFMGATPIFGVGKVATRRVFTSAKNQKATLSWMTYP